MEQRRGWMRTGMVVLLSLGWMTGVAGAQEGKAKAPQAVYAAVRDRVRLGGYGSVRFETNDLEETNAGFDFRRFVLTVDASPAKRLHAYLELELERFTALELELEAEAEAGGLKVEQAVEGSNEAEISIGTGLGAVRHCPLAQRAGRSSARPPGPL